MFTSRRFLYNYIYVYIPPFPFLTEIKDSFQKECRLTKYADVHCTLTVLLFTRTFHTFHLYNMYETHIRMTKRYTVKKCCRFFTSPAGMSLPKLSLAGKIVNLFLKCTLSLFIMLSSQVNVDSSTISSLFNNTISLFCSFISASMLRAEYPRAAAPWTDIRVLSSRYIFLFHNASGKITGAFFTLKVWWIFSTYYDGFKILLAQQ
jgi:hypothetical protein